jgi:AcrR family transcriptional regulator
VSAVPAGGRRERLRAATIQEIKATARRLLVAEGPHSVTLRAIAREIGMTAPGLYRYFPSHEDLWHDLCHDTYAAIADAIEAALEPLPPEQVELRLLTACREFRSWAVAHPREFGLVFGMPLPGLVQVKDLTNPEHIAGMRFALVFTQAFADLWTARPFPVVADEDLPAELSAQLRRYRAAVAGAPGARVGDQLPLGAILVFLQAWVQLYGIVTMEVFGHLGFCLDDVGEFFDTELARIGRMLGIEELPLPGAGFGGGAGTPG